MNRSAFFVQETQQALESKIDANDSVLFAKLYDQYAALMLGVITKMIPDKERAISLLETAFGHVNGQIAQLQKTKQPLFVSLLQIARRVAVDSLRESRTNKAVTVQLTQNEQLVAPTQPKHEGPVSEQIHSVDAQRRKLFDAVLFKNCTPEEAAAQVGIPADQAREQLRLAFRQMRTPKS